jgi:hypothetical protein
MVAERMAVAINFWRRIAMLFVQVTRCIYKFHPVQIFGVPIHWVNTSHYLRSWRG